MDLIKTGQKLTLFLIKNNNTVEISCFIENVYDDRIVVYMGLPEHIDYKVQTAHTVIKEKIDVGGSMIAGDLDVSMCYDTMKSYFNQYTLLSPHVTATEPATEEEQVETQMVYY